MRDKLSDARDGYTHIRNAKQKSGSHTVKAHNTIHHQMEMRHNRRFLDISHEYPIII